MEHLVFWESHIQELENNGVDPDVIEFMKLLTKEDNFGYEQGQIREQIHLGVWDMSSMLSMYMNIPEPNDEIFYWSGLDKKEYVQTMLDHHNNMDPIILDILGRTNNYN